MIEQFSLFHRIGFWGLFRLLSGFSSFDRFFAKQQNSPRRLSSADELSRSCLSNDMSAWARRWHLTTQPAPTPTTRSRALKPWNVPAVVGGLLSQPVSGRAADTNKVTAGAQAGQRRRTGWALAQNLWFYIRRRFHRWRLISWCLLSRELAAGLNLSATDKNPTAVKQNQLRIFWWMFSHWIYNSLIGRKWVKLHCS